MASRSKYNRNYPYAHKVEHGMLLSMDGVKIAQEYMEKLLFMDVQNSAKVNGAHLINFMIKDLIGAKYVSLSNARIRFNYWMSLNESAPEQMMQLLCSLIEDLLFKSDDYRGWGNYKWLHGGHSAWHAVYQDKYSSEEKHAIALEAMKEYQSQEYHREYN